MKPKKKRKKKKEKRKKKKEKRKRKKKRKEEKKKRVKEKDLYAETLKANSVVICFLICTLKVSTLINKEVQNAHFHF